MNISLVQFAVGRFRNRGTGAMEDIVQVGTIGLIKAVDRFDLCQSRVKGRASGIKGSPTDTSGPVGVGIASLVCPGVRAGRGADPSPRGVP